MLSRKEEKKAISQFTHRENLLSYSLEDLFEEFYKNTGVYVKRVFFDKEEVTITYYEED